jgi:hypothetical protein
LVTEHHNQWDQILPQAEFAYNDSPNRSTGKIPFQIVYGMHPRGISELRIWDKMSSEVQEQKTLLQRCRSCMIRSRDNYKIAAKNTRDE